MPRRLNYVYFVCYVFFLLFHILVTLGTISNLSSYLKDHICDFLFHLTFQSENPSKDKIPPWKCVIEARRIQIFLQKLVRETVVMKGLLGRLITRTNLRSCRLLTKTHVENGSLSTSRRFLYALSSNTPYVFSDFTSLKPSKFPSSCPTLWSHFGGKFFFIFRYFLFFNWCCIWCGFLQLHASRIGVFWIFLGLWIFMGNGWG